MPKIAPLPVDAMTQHITRNVKKRAIDLGIDTDKELCDKIVMDPSTFRYRKKKPCSWRVEELAFAAIVLKVPLWWFITEHNEKPKEPDKGG